MITWIKKTSSFQTVKAQPQSGCCLVSAWFFANFSLVLLLKVLIKEIVYHVVLKYLMPRPFDSRKGSPIIRPVGQSLDDPNGSTNISG